MNSSASRYQLSFCMLVVWRLEHSMSITALIGSFSSPLLTSQNSISPKSWDHSSWSTKSARLCCVQQKERKRQKDNNIPVSEVQSPHVYCAMLQTVPHKTTSTEILRCDARVTAQYSTLSVIATITL